MLVAFVVAVIVEVVVVMVDGDASCSDVVPSGRNSGDNGTST